MAPRAGSRRRGPAPFPPAGAKAYEDLARFYLRPSYVIALARLGSPEDAELIAQDVLRTVLGGTESDGEASKFSSWLFAKVRERALDCLRRSPSNGPAGHPPGAGRSEPSPEQAVGGDSLLSALFALDPTRREVVLLHDLAAWSHGQIAGALGLREEDSRQQLSEARTILHNRMGTSSDQPQ